MDITSHDISDLSWTLGRQIDSAKVFWVFFLLPLSHFRELPSMDPINVGHFGEEAFSG